MIVPGDRRIFGLELGGTEEPVGRQQRPARAGLGEDFGLGRDDQQQRRFDAGERVTRTTVAQRAAVPHGMSAAAAATAAVRDLQRGTDTGPPPSSPPSGPVGRVLPPADTAVRGTAGGAHRLPGHTGRTADGRADRGRSATGRRTGDVRRGRQLFRRELRLGHQLAQQRGDGQRVAGGRQTSRETVAGRRGRRRTDDDDVDADADDDCDDGDGDDGDQKEQKQEEQTVRRRSGGGGSSDDGDRGGDRQDRCDGAAGVR